MTDGGARERALDRITEIVLGGAPQFTREDVAAAAGLTVEEARPYWRAMGFPDVGAGRAFTEGDMESLRMLAGWVRAGRLDEARAIEVVRGMGQTASRLADWQVDTMVRILSAAEEPVELDAVADGLTTILPGVESLLVHAWRRHLAAAMRRGLATGDESDDDGDASLATVGFADIAGFTRLSRAMAEDELAGMVEAFETGAADIVAAHGARLVKTLGDEVMFIAPGADAAVASATAMHRLEGPGPEALRLRIGLATGRLVTLMGDAYGETVNRASRLTAIARPGTTLMDTATEESLSEPASYVLRHHRPRGLRGLGMVRATSVARREA